MNETSEKKEPFLPGKAESERASSFPPRPRIVIERKSAGQGNTLTSGMIIIPRLQTREKAEVST